MKFKIDENLPAEIADEIRSFGHEANTVFGEQLAGAADQKILATAQAEERILLTMDKGIADVRFHPPERFAGIVLFRPRRTGRSATIEFARRHLSALVATKLAGHIAVVSEAGIRIR